MSDWIEQEDWSTVKVGDQVRVTHEGGMLTGKIQHIYTTPVCRVRAIDLEVGILSDTVQVRCAGWSLFVPAKPAVVLPSEAGWYVDPQQDVWKLNASGVWYCLLSPNDTPDNYAPFTRLEPVAETAKKVLVDVAELAEEHGVNWFAFELRDVAHKFGVTNV